MHKGAIFKIIKSTPALGPSKTKEPKRINLPSPNPTRKWTRQLSHGWHVKKAPFSRKSHGSKFD